MFFEGWEGYLPKLEANWRTLISPQDTVILAGDTSWAMKLEDTKTDFAFIQNLPGQKWLLKGNHDYWWTTARKMERYLTENGFDTMHILHNNACMVGDYALCGTRGWPFDDTNAQDAKIMAREAGRCACRCRQGGAHRKLHFCITRQFIPAGAHSRWWISCMSLACSNVITATCTESPSAGLSSAKWMVSATSWFRRTVCIFALIKSVIKAFVCSFFNFFACKGNFISKWAGILCRYMI